MPLLLLVAVVAACGGSPAGSEPATGAATGSPAEDSEAPPSLEPGTRVVAQALKPAVEVYAGPAGGPSLRHLTSTAPGLPLVFQVIDQHGVIDQRAERIQVRLPIRPNGSTGWIDQGLVKLTTVDWQLEVSPAAHSLRVLRAGRVVETDPVGIGRGVSPTPAGHYYVTELLRPSNPAGSYGPYAFGLSAFSPTLTDFAGGPGQIGLHGTNEPAGIGHDVSHGCIRVDNAVITRLGHELPLGTPVEIEASR